MNKFFRVTLKGEPRIWFDIPCPEDLNLNQFMSNALVAGYVMWEKGFVPMYSIAYIVVVETAGVTPPMSFTRN